MRFYDLKLGALDVERRYKAEQLKPKASIKYNFLAAPSAQAGDYDIQNHKIGFSIASVIQQTTITTRGVTALSHTLFESGSKCTYSIVKCT